MKRRDFIIGSAAALVAAPLGAAIPGAAPRGLLCSGFYPNGFRRCTAGILLSTLNVAGLHPQFASMWCWAACIQGVFAYYGHPVQQARIVSDAYGQPANLPGTLVAILGQLNRHWVDDNGVPFQSMANAWGVDASVAAGELIADRPLIVGTLGHAMILTAITYDQHVQGAWQIVDATVRDPWPLNPRVRSLSANEWVNIKMAAAISVI